ncbi:MAG: sugar phosphate isomerase/epimerase [Actinobacteria bacterium]|nr:sugar phosphate isomerase/epimerase [Actinomycetota bacterium]
MTTAPIRLANAPVSYGVFGDLSVEGASSPAELLMTMAEAGYEGSEIGPPGFFGTVDELTDAFASAGLTAVGAYVPLHTQGPDAVLARDLSRMEQTLTELLAVNPDAVVILADEGSDALLANPCHSPALGLDEDGWARLVDVVRDAVRRVEEVGLQPSFHSHIATFVEQPHEIERLLAETPVGLTYDVGHVVMGGGDALGSWRAWRDRVNHVHLKDVHLDVLRRAIAERRTDFDTWWADLCTPLGAGDLDLDGFVAALVADGYRGWAVVEQDRAPLTAADVERVVADQAANRAWASARLGALHPIARRL